MDPDKLLPGEIAVPLDSEEVYACFSPGNVQRMATHEAMKEQIVDATADVVEDVKSDFASEMLAATEKAVSVTAEVREIGTMAKANGELAGTNAQAADAATVKALAAAGGDISNKTVTFITPDEYAVPVSGATLAVLLGKITRGMECVEEKMNGIWESIYPIGAIYMSVSPTSPEELFGGAWTAWGSGRVPVGVDTSDTNFNTAEKTGGSITQALRALIGAVNSSTMSIGYYAGSAIASFVSNVTYAITGTQITGSKTFSHTTPVYRSDGETPNTLQPYITCYMWKRIS